MFPSGVVRSTAGIRLPVTPARLWLPGMRRRIQLDIQIRLLFPLLSRALALSQDHPK